MTRRQLVRAGLAALALPLSACTPLPGELSQTVFCFNTVCTLGGVMEQEVLEEAIELCELFEQLFSRTIRVSDVGRINSAGGEEVEVDERTSRLIARSLEYSRESDGLFDITIGAVSELWDFVEGVVPSADEVKRALVHVGWQNVRVEDNIVALADPKARIDLGGIAKGFVADELVALFEERGVKSAYVNLGGNVKVLGAKADGTPWSVGVRDPGDPGGGAVVAKVSTTGGSLVTSGLYERSFEKDGQRYWHILDPRTGYPAQTQVVSASVFSQASIDGDGYTKPLFMMEPERGLRFLEEHGVEGLLVLSSGEKHATPYSNFAWT